MQSYILLAKAAGTAQKFCTLQLLEEINGSLIPHSFSEGMVFGPYSEQRAIEITQTEFDNKPLHVQTHFYSYEKILDAVRKASGDSGKPLSNWK